MTGMPNHVKYQRGYFMPPEPCYDWVKKEYIEKAPKWVSVDLRDGNQALIIPMSLEQKLEYFKKLVEIGFKEIEIGFPAASETEFELARTLIENDMIPEDVTIQVLTQAREHIIKKTFDALEGCKTPVIVHVYNSTSLAQREQVFKRDKEQIKEIALTGANLLKQLTDEAGHDNYRFEYSPESFTGTEPEYALEVCNAVLDVWQPTPDRKAIINLPATVEMSLPHVFAQQVEYMSKNLKYRDAVELSLHCHNDRGTGVAETELGILAGADRVEGTLFGNGERTGNTDLITVAMNMFAHGVDPELNFANMPELVELYERVTNMKVEPRRPYAGQLVFAAFSGSHQDAIAKGLKWREEHDPEHWTTPYHFTHAENNKAFKAFVTVKIDGDEQDVIGNGNGRLDSVCNAMEKLGLKAHIASYSEHAMTGGSDSSAMAYVGVEDPNGKIVWGAGEHHDIITASIKGLISALNRM